MLHNVGFPHLSLQTGNLTFILSSDGAQSFWMIIWIIDGSYQLLIYFFLYVLARFKVNMNVIGGCRNEGEKLKVEGDVMQEAIL